MADVSFENDPFPVEIDFAGRREWYTRRLEVKSREDSILLSARASLRVVPSGFILESPQEFEQHRDTEITPSFLTLLRCNLISNAASYASSLKYDQFVIAARSAQRAEKTSRSTYNRASDSADFSAAAVAAKHSLVDSFSAPAAAFASTFYPAETSSAFEADWAMLDGSIEARRRLTASQLWLQEGGPPNEVVLKCEFLSILLAAHFNDWDVWAQWYGGGEHNGESFPGVMQGARDGKYLFGLPTARALKLSHDVALIDDALWKGDPAALNAEFKRLVDEARAENIEIAHKAMLDRISDLEQELQTQRELQNRSAVIGHNNPPETIDAFGISETEWTEVKEAIKSLKEQPRQPKDGGESAKSAVQKLKAIVSKGSAYLLTEAGKEIVKQAIKESWPALGQVVGAIFARLKFLIDAALHWLSLLN